MHCLILILKFSQLLIGQVEHLVWGYVLYLLGLNPCFHSLFQRFAPEQTVYFLAGFQLNFEVLRYSNALNYLLKYVPTHHAWVVLVDFFEDFDVLVVQEEKILMDELY